jgi:hypothetical protein
MSFINPDKIKIIDLFHNVVKYGYVVRKYRLDGKNAWSNLENQITSCNFFLGIWTPLSYKFYDDLISMGVVEHQTSLMTKEEWLYHHFLLQHGRLARKDCYLNRLLQIAYNAGQLSYCLKKRQGSYVYTQELIGYYVLNSMGTAETYVDLNYIKLNKMPNGESCIDNMIKWIQNEILKIRSSK